MKSDPNFSIGFFIGMLGLNHSLFTILIYFHAGFSIDLLNSVAIPIPSILNSLSKFLIVSLFALAADVIIGILILFFSDFYKGRDILLDWLDLKDEIENTPEKTQNVSLVLFKYVLWVFGLGFLAGLYYALLYGIPYFLIFITLNFILRFVSDFALRLIANLFITWFVIYILILRGKLDFKEKIEDDSQFQQDFAFTERTDDIMATGEDPIICPACKSYIASNSVKCKVCGEKI